MRHFVLLKQAFGTDTLDVLIPIDKIMEVESVGNDDDGELAAGARARVYYDRGEEDTLQLVDVVETAAEVQDEIRREQRRP